MEILTGLLIIAAGSFGQSSSYVPIRKVKAWSWESFWLVQGLFAWLIFPLLGALLAVPEGHRLVEVYAANPGATLWTIFFGILWGIGGLTFGLSMRYLGIALGQSIALGTCAGLGTILTLLFTGRPGDLTMPVIAGVAVTLAGIAVIGYAGSLKSATLSEEEKKESVKDFHFTRGIMVALSAGFMSACFSIGLGFGESLCFTQTADIYKTLPATLMVTLGGFVTNATYCFYQHAKNRTWSDYGQTGLYVNNLFFCALAGVLWYSQFFGLSLGKGFLSASPVLLTFSWCILMALNVTFSNVWGILLKEWKGCSKQTIAVLIAGLLLLVFSSFLPELLK